MVPVRIAFDASLPFVVSQGFTIGERVFKDGEPLLWRDAGIDEPTLYSLWRSGLVSCTPALVAATPSAAPAPAAKPKHAQRR